MDVCPHGHRHPVVVRLPWKGPEKEQGPKIEVVHDSRECWQCLTAQLLRANKLVVMLGQTPGHINHPFNNLENLQLFFSYMAEFNP